MKILNFMTMNMREIAHKKVEIGKHKEILPRTSKHSEKMSLSRPRYWISG